MIRKEDINHYSTTQAQRKAFKKYADKNARINVMVSKEKKLEIEKFINDYDLYLSKPEFIRDAIDYYMNDIKEGKIIL